MFLVILEPELLKNIGAESEVFYDDSIGFTEKEYYFDIQGKSIVASEPDYAGKAYIDLVIHSGITLLEFVEFFQSHNIKTIIQDNYF